MRRGATATHIFKILIQDLNPKAIQITYKQGNKIILQKHMDDIEIYTLLYKNILLDDDGNVVINPGSGFNISVEDDTANIVATNVIVKDRCMYFTTEEGIYPGTSLLVKLSQQETFLFNANDYATVQVRIIRQDDTSLVSTLSKFKVEDCLDENLLPIDEYTPFF